MKKRNMVVVNFQEVQRMTTGANEWIKAKSEGNGMAPTVERRKKFTFSRVDGVVKKRSERVTFGIKTVVTDHFKMFVRDMADKSFNKIQCGKRFVNKDIVFVAIIMKSDRSPIVGINTGSGNDRTTKIAADILSNLIRITDIIFSVNIKTIRAGFVDERFNRIKSGTNPSGETVKQSGPESITEELEVKVRNFAPGSTIACPAFRDKNMNMGIPF
jgi:hypothetical protein